MSNYHIQIVQERRVSTPEQPRQLATLIGEQLHTHTDANLNRIVGEESLPPDFSDPQFVMIAEWDGKSPYIICHKGDYSARTMEYAGWPDLTETQWAALQNSTEGFL